MVLVFWYHVHIVRILHIWAIGQFCSRHRYLAVGGSIKTVAESYRVAPCTATGIIYEVCEALYRRLAPLHLRSPTVEDWRSAAADFAGLWQLPNCIGAIDGKHVAVEKPSSTGTLYYNYKGLCSVVLLAVADARYRWVQLRLIPIPRTWV